MSWEWQLKLIEMVLKPENNFEFQSSFHHRHFHKVVNEEIFLKKIKISKTIRNMIAGGGSCSSSSPSGNLVDGLPLVAILTHSSNSWALPPQRSMMLDVNVSIQLILCIWVASSVTSEVFKSYWKSFLRVPALVLDQTHVLNPALWKCWYFNGFS